MRLSTYMTNNGLTDAAFADLVKSSAFAVGKWRRLERIPRTPYMRRITEMTGGQVTANDFVADETAAAT